MHSMTEANLKAAFAGESQAHVKYLNFSEKAKAENKPNVARLFAAASYSEQVHASSHLKKGLAGVASTSENLAAAINGEGFEVDEMYPAFMSVAESQGETAAKTSFNRANEAEKIHRALYSKAKEAVDAGNDAAIGDVWVCGNCGSTSEGAQPDKCSLCGAGPEVFVKFQLQS